MLDDEIADMIHPHGWTLIETRPAAPLWPAAGVLPPVGTVCEARMESEWVTVQVMYLSKHTALLSFFTDDDDCEGAYSPKDCRFRPIRTAEQIEAEEKRNLQIEQLASMIAGYMGFDDPRESDTKLAVYLFDHDFRKQVSP